MTINSTSEIINALKKGDMVIIMDDENRENEGDLIVFPSYAAHRVVNHTSLVLEVVVQRGLLGDRPLAVQRPRAPVAVAVVEVRHVHGLEDGPGFGLGPRPLLRDFHEAVLARRRRRVGVR